MPFTDKKMTEKVYIFILLISISLWVFGNLIINGKKSTSDIFSVKYFWIYIIFIASLINATKHQDIAKFFKNLFDVYFLTYFRVMMVVLVKQLFLLVLMLLSMFESISFDHFVESVDKKHSAGDWLLPYFFIWPCIFFLEVLYKHFYKKLDK